MENKVTENFGDLSLIDICYACPDDNSTVLVLVTVGFIDGSPETQKNLLNKLEGYLKHIQTDEFKQDYPFANVYIVVSFEEKPDVLITDLLYKCIDWCKDNGALLKIQIGEDYVRLAE